MYKTGNDMNYFELQKKFPTNEAVIDYFIGLRYKGETPACIHCGNVHTYHRSNTPKVFHCVDCNNTFSVFKDTIFENSSTDMVKWMYAIHLFLNGKKGISGYQLMREIGVTYKTAWRMLKQIRTAMGNQETKQVFEAIVEIDETYVGGKPRPMNKKEDNKKKENSDNPNKRGRGTSKTPVVAVISRDDKQVHAKVALPNKEGKKLSGKQLLKILADVTKEGATVITDGLTSYNILDAKSSKYVHLKVDHNVMFVDGIKHTNNVESFWATLKRGVYGIYHQVSPKYMQQYVNEFCFRYNYRKNPDIFDLLLKRAVI
jgi:transposase-like protein